MELDLIAHIVLFVILTILVIWVLSSTFEPFSFGLAVVLTTALIFTNPKIFERVQAECAIQYYTIILLATIFFALDGCKADFNLILLLILTGLITVVSLYAGKKSFLYLAIFMNLYLICRVGKMFWERPIDAPCE